MNREVIITCALTGAGDSSLKSDKVPVTPEEIAADAVRAAKAGAAVVHVHVRDPQTRRFSRSLALYRETARLIRESGVDMVLNITAGMGADFVPDKGNPNIGGPGSDMISPYERVRHILDIKPEISTLDCGTMNYTASAYIATMDMLRETSKYIKDAGVKAEVEVFELGHIWQAKQLIREGLLAPDCEFQLCMGVPYAAEATPGNMLAMRDALPPGVNWSSFALGQMQLPWVAMSVLFGGNVRVGLEDNIYLSRGHMASNEELVVRAREIIEKMGGSVLGPRDARVKMGLA
jgi:uncharacterized protein (DUF849 family)